MEPAFGLDGGPRWLAAIQDGILIEMSEPEAPPQANARPVVAIDPLILAAANDVDVTLLADALSRPPFERLRMAARTQRNLSRWRDALSTRR